MTKAPNARAVSSVDDPTRLVLDVRSRPQEVATARHAVARHLAALGLPSVVVDDMELVTSELVTNAIVHPRPADPERRVLIDVAAAGDVKLEVANQGSIAGIPAVDGWVPAPPSALSGRGLGIVRRLCDDVHVEQVGEWAVVSCRRRLPDLGVVR